MPTLEAETSFGFDTRSKVKDSGHPQIPLRRLNLSSVMQEFVLKAFGDISLCSVWGFFFKSQLKSFLFFFFAAQSFTLKRLSINV